MYVHPKEAAKFYQVSEQALRNWSIKGKIKYITTKGGHRRYLISEENKDGERQKIIYARVSSRKQKEDLQRQKTYLQTKYPEHKLISDIGSGINSKRKGFRSILEGVFKGTIEEVVVASKDRFSRFNFELFEWIFQEHNSFLISDSKEPSKTEEQELSEDLMSIVTIFSSRFYGRKRYKVLQENKNLSD